MDPVNCFCAYIKTFECKHFSNSITVQNIKKYLHSTDKEHKNNLHWEGNLNSYTSNYPSDTDCGVNTSFVLCDDYALKERQSPLVGSLLQVLLQVSIIFQLGIDQASH
jgi:hypothetical protein